MKRARALEPKGLARQSRGFERPSREEFGRNLQRRALEIGRWIIIPLAIIVVVLLIPVGNWWLDVKILTSMYFNKAAGMDWWKINYIDNYYFYACIGVGLLVALSDPRIGIEKDAEGKRRFYLHSKFWALIRGIIGEVSGYQRSPILISTKGEPYSDKITLRWGIVWKLAEFLAGAIIIGPLVASNMGLVYLMIGRWLETQHTTWVGFIQNSFSVLYARLFNPEALEGFDLGNWLITNSPGLEFLTWLRTPVSIFVGIWSVRLGISAILELRQRRIVRFFRDLVGIGFLILIPYVLLVPTLAFDVTTPFYVRTALIAMALLAISLVFLSLNTDWVQSSVSRISRNRVVAFLIVIAVSVSLLYGPIVVALQYAPAMGGHYETYLWEPKYLPNIIYTRWATGLESIKESDITAAINTGTNLEILSKVRVFSDVAAETRFRPSIGVNWMDFPTPVSPAITSVDIVYAKGREYWLAPLTIVMPPGGTSEDMWRSSRLLITHSERILAMDAATGEIVPMQSVFNLTQPYSIYYGEGGLFASSPQVYIGIPNIAETHLPNYTGPLAYNGAPDYVLSGLDRIWFFLGIDRREGARWDFARGDYGDVKMLFMRDIGQRLKNILLPGMTIDNDPYIVSDGVNVYYSLYVYIDRTMPTEYLDYPSNQDRFWRVFATILVNAYDGNIQGYLLGTDEDNYVLDFYRGMYPQWNQPIPNWLQSQLRYPEFLFDKQIVSYDTYHVSSPDYWQRGTDFFELTTNTAGIQIEAVRYVSFYLNGTTYWAAVRLVEFASSPGKNLAGMYVAMNGKNLGNVFLLRTGNVAVIGPQTALDSITNYGPTQTQLTLNKWQSGNILMYVINNRPYYFVPYYGGTATTLAPAMIAIVDALSQKVGYYVIANPQNSAEVGSASERAYFNLMGSTVVETAEARKKNVLNEFGRRGYTVKTPSQLNPPVAYQEASISYNSDADWAKTNATISSFVSTWAAPYGVTNIVLWETAVSNMRYLNLGTLINNAGVLELHYITIAYG